MVRKVALKAANGLYVEYGSWAVMANSDKVIWTSVFSLENSGNQMFCRFSTGFGPVVFEGGSMLAIANFNFLQRNGLSFPPSAETFEIIDKGNGKVALKAKGAFLSADERFGGRLSASATTIGPSELFELIDVIELFPKSGQAMDLEYLQPGGHDMSNTIGKFKKISMLEGLNVTLYSDAGLTNKILTMTKPTVEFGVDLKEQVKGILVKKTDLDPNAVYIYQNLYFSGLSQALLAGNYDKKNITIGDNQLSSLTVPRGMKVTIYDKEGFAGMTRTFYRDKRYFGQYFDNVTSSLKVEKLPEGGGVNKSNTNVLLFNGLDTYGSADLNVSETDYTVSIWFKTTNKNCGIFTVDLGEKGEKTRDRHIYLKGGFINVRMWKDEWIRGKRNDLADGNWHKVTHVFGGAIGAQRVYVDGVLEATGTLKFSSLTEQDGINIGFSNDAPNNFFAGEIAEVSIWNIARPEADIILQNEVLTGSEPGLQAYWNFKDGVYDTVTDRTKNKVELIVDGYLEWKTAADFSGMFIPVVTAKEVGSMRADADKTIKATEMLVDTDTKIVDTLPPKPVSELIKNDKIGQYGLLQTASTEVKNNKLVLTESMLGNFGGIGSLISSFLGSIPGINNPKISFVKIVPGTSGAEGESFGADPSASLTLATAQNTALHISGDATIFSGMNVQLKYAEFSQLLGKPYGVLKFIGSAPIGISKMLPGVPLLDGMQISEPTIILSSTGDLTDSVLGHTFVEGFNFFGKYLPGASNDKMFKFISGLLGVSELQLHGAVDTSDSTPAYQVEATIPVEKFIVDSSDFKLKFSKARMGITIKGTPLEPALKISGETIVTLKTGSDITNLVFYGGLKLEAESVTGSFTMKAKNDLPFTSLSGNVVAAGEWKDPFGIPGITIREMALQMGFTYAAPWIDNVGVHGNMKIGDVDGSISILIDTNDPDEFVLAGATDRITLLQIITSMTPPTFIAYNRAPFNVKNVLEKFVNVQLTDVKINIVPSATSIGDIDFEEGVTIRGKLNAWGWGSALSVKVDHTDGLDINGEMDNIDIAGVLKVSGSQNAASPTLKMKLSPKEMPDMLISANVSVLGLSQELEVKGTSSGFSFHFDRSIAGILHTQFDCAFGKDNFKVAGSVSFNLNLNIPSPFGDIPLVDVSMEGSISMEAGASVGFDLIVNGSFSFYKKAVTMPQLRLKVPPGDFQAIFFAVVDQIKNNAKQMFLSVFGTLEEWANAVKDGVVSFAGDVASLAKDIYAATSQEVIAIYNTLEKGFEELGTALGDTYNMTAGEIAKGMRDFGHGMQEISQTLGSIGVVAGRGLESAFNEAGYRINEVGDLLKHQLGPAQMIKGLKAAGYFINDIGGYTKAAFALGAAETAKLLNEAGYACNVVGSAVEGVYHLGLEETAKVLNETYHAIEWVALGVRGAFGDAQDTLAKGLKGAGYAADQVGGFLTGTCNATLQGATNLLKGANYAAEEVGGFIKNIAGQAAAEAAKLMDAAGYALKDIGNGLVKAYDLVGADAVAKALKVGVEIEKVGKILVDTFSKENAAKAMKAAGYAVAETGQFFIGAYGTVASELGPILNDAGYAAEETGKFFVSLGGTFESFGNQMVDGLKKADPTTW